MRVVVDINGIREGIDQDLPVEALDQNNNPIANLTIQPETSHVTLPVIQQGGYRDMAVKVIVRGQVAPGYRLESISVFPPVVTVYSANPDLVSALPGVVDVAFADRVPFFIGFDRQTMVWPAARLTQVIFVGVNVLNPAVYLGVAAMQCVVMAVACLGPALRAARIDPLLALRAD